MQTFKKIIFSIFVFVFIFSVYKHTYANVSASASSPVPAETQVTFYCTQGDRVIVFDAQGGFIDQHSCSPSSGYAMTQSPGVYQVHECDSSQSESNCDANGTHDINFMYSDSGFYSQGINNFTWSAPIGGGEEVAGIHFFSDSVLTGDNSVTSQLTASVGTTTGSLTPVLAVVGGIILAMIGISWVVRTLKETGNSKKR